jgi:heat shock protein HslJ
VEARWNGATITGFALAALLGGCATVAETTAPPPLDGTAWTLAALPGSEIAPSPRVTLQFDAGRVSGSDGCNRYSGAYTVTGGKLELSPLASTQMACAPEVMELAKAFTSALTGARSVRVADRRLELLSDDGTVRAAFDPQSRELAGTAWHATGINNGREAVVSVLPDTTVTLALGTDGRATGSAGCNAYTAAYTADGSTVTFGPAATTRKTCARPEGVMEQEQAFLKALATVASAHREGERLVLRTASGAIALSLARADGG